MKKLALRARTLKLADGEAEAIGSERCSACGHLSSLHYDYDGFAGCMVGTCGCLGDRHPPTKEAK